jgi:microcystin-dependent protein
MIIKRITKTITTMKQIYITLIALIFSATLFAQGIAVQGIARDNNKAALPQKDLNFTFRIISKDGDERYTESQPIRTDNFGVFSHIVGTGTKLNGVDFSEQGLKIEVSILYPNKVIVYNEGFNYTPYAHYAANGVPSGTVVAFLGDDSKIPAGWVKCIGQDISSDNQYSALRAVIGNTIPDLRARFLRGQGESSNIDVRIYDETTSVGQYLDQTIALHKHNVNINSNTTGEHSHNAVVWSNGSGNSTKDVVNLTRSNTQGNSPRYQSATSNAGNHSHNINGDSGDVETIQNGGQIVSNKGEENRPWTVVVNYIIKL